MIYGNHLVDQGSLKGGIKQCLNVAGDVEGFPFGECIVWVGTIMTPVDAF